MQFGDSQCGGEGSASLWGGVGDALTRGESLGGASREDGSVDSSSVETGLFSGFVRDGWTPPMLFSPRVVRGFTGDDGIWDDDEPLDDDDDDFFPDDIEDDDDEEDDVDDDDLDDDFE